MKKTTYLITVFALLMTTNINAQWAISYSNTSGSKTYCDVKFLSNSLGFALAQERQVLKTTDGGATWMELTPIPGSSIMASIDFVSENVGVAVGAGGAVYRTIDGGSSWSIPTESAGSTTGQTIPMTRAFNCVRFFDATTGYIGGNAQTLFKTTDGGANWVRQINDGTANHFQAISPITANSIKIATLYAATYSWNGSVLSQTDLLNNGLTSNSGYYGSCFIDSVRGYVVGYRRNTTYPDILKTTDGGVKWIKSSINDSNTSGGLKDVVFVDSISGIAVGDAGSVWETANSGVSWVKNSNSIFTGVPLKAVEKTPNGDLYVAGTNKIIKYTNSNTRIDDLVGNSKINVFVINKTIDVMSNFGIEQIDIFNLSGSKLYCNRSKNQHVICNVNFLSKGVYLIKIKSAKGSEVKKITVN